MKSIITALCLFVSLALSAQGFNPATVLQDSTGSRFPIKSPVFYASAYMVSANGTTDDRANLQKAIDAAGLVGGRVILPNGKVNVSDAGAGYCLRIKSNVLLEGQGVGTRLANTSATATTIYLHDDNDWSANVTIQNITFNPTVTHSRGAYEIWCDRAMEIRLYNLHGGRPAQMNTNPIATIQQESNLWGFISLTGNCGNIFINGLTGFGASRILDIQGNTSGSGRCNDIYLNDWFFDTNKVNDTAIRANLCDAIIASGIDIVNSQNVNGFASGTSNPITAVCLLFDGDVSYCSFTNFYFDTHGWGAVIKGNCQGDVFLGSWTSSRPNQGFLITSGPGGNPEGIQLSHMRFADDGGPSVQINAGKGHTVDNCLFAASGNNTAGLACISIGSGVSHTKIKDNYGSNTLFQSRIGTGAAGVGLSIAPGATFIQVDGNDFSELPVGFQFYSTGIYEGLLNIGSISRTPTPVVSAAFTGASGTAITAYTPETGTFTATSGSSTLDGNGFLNLVANGTLDKDLASVNQAIDVVLGTYADGANFIMRFNYVSQTNCIGIQVNTVPGSTTLWQYFILVDGNVVASTAAQNLPPDRKLSASVINGVASISGSNVNLSATVPVRTSTTVRTTDDGAFKVDNLNIYKY